MQSGTPLREHLENLNSILLDLWNLDVKINDEDVALIILVSSPSSYANFVDSFVVGKESLTLKERRKDFIKRNYVKRRYVRDDWDDGSGFIGWFGRNSRKKRGLTMVKVLGRVGARSGIGNNTDGSGNTTNKTWYYFKEPWKIKSKFLELKNKLQAILV